jgi:hypothetical protein
MLRRAAIATLAVTVAVSVAAAAHAEGGTRYFRAKPSGIGCGVFRLQRSSATVRCDLPLLGSRAAFLHTRGQGAIKSVPSFLHPRDQTVLRQGDTGRYGPFTCTSRPTAVSCDAGGGHGFTVGRKFQLVF